MVGHARRILAAHDEAWQDISGSVSESRIRIGMTQDFADSDLPTHLNTFARLHSRVRIDLRVGKSSELVNDFSAGRIDLLLVMRLKTELDEIVAIKEPMIWLCVRNGLFSEKDEIPLALLDPPCTFRDAAVSALETGGRPYRFAATSSSLSGVRAAVHAGLAITVRTARWVGNEIDHAPGYLKLPPLPDAEFCVRVKHDASEATFHLADVISKGISHR